MSALKIIIYDLEPPFNTRNDHMRVAKHIQDLYPEHSHVGPTMRAGTRSPSNRAMRSHRRDRTDRCAKG